MMNSEPSGIRRNQTMMTSAVETAFMKEAIEIGRKSRPEDEDIHPLVGAIVAMGQHRLARACRGEFEPGEHAEFTAFWHHLRNADLKGGTLYTTLEPCTYRRHGKYSCVEWIISHEIRTVVIGMLDPNPAICGKGYWSLREAGIKVKLFSPELMSQVEEDNRRFIKLHDPTRCRVAASPVGTEPVHEEAEEQIVRQYCAQSDFPAQCYIAEKWEPNVCFTTLPAPDKLAALKIIKRMSPEKLDRVKRDIFLIKGSDSTGQPNMLLYYSGRPQTGWNTWLLPSRKRDFEQNLTERLRYHQIDLAAFLNVQPDTVSVRYAPSLPLTVCAKVNRYAKEKAYRTTPRIYSFRYCFVTVRNPPTTLLQANTSMNVDGYVRRLKWLQPEAFEQDRRMWNADADVIRTVERVFENMLARVPNSLGRKRLAF
jgi:pyrimidine deaminase RibD-like protein